MEQVINMSLSRAGTACISTLPGSAVHRLGVEIYQRHRDDGAGQCVRCYHVAPCPSRRHSAVVIEASGDKPERHDRRAAQLRLIEVSSRAVRPGARASAYEGRSLGGSRNARMTHYDYQR